MSGSISNRILEVDVKTFEICRREDWKEIRESDLLVDKAKKSGCESMYVSCLLAFRLQSQWLRSSQAKMNRIVVNASEEMNSLGWIK